MTGSMLVELIKNSAEPGVRDRARSFIRKFRHLSYHVFSESSAIKCFFDNFRLLLFGNKRNVATIIRRRIHIINAVSVNFSPSDMLFVVLVQMSFLEMKSILVANV